MAELVFKISPENIIGDFGYMESWSKGTSVPPDGWEEYENFGTISQESSIVKYGAYSTKIISAAGNSGKIAYSIEDYFDYAGKKISFGVWVRCSSASKARIFIDDGVSSREFSVTHSGSGSFEFLTCSLDLDENLTELTFGLEVQSGTVTAYFDGAIVVEGEMIFTDFRGDNVFVFDNSFRSNVTFNIGSFSIPRRRGTEIGEVKEKEKQIRLKFQIHSDSFLTSRGIYDNLIKALSDGVKDLYFADDRLMKCVLAGISNLQYEARAKVHFFDVQIRVPSVFENYIGKFRTTQNITSSPHEFQLRNDGSVTVNPSILIYPAATTVSSILFENVTTNERFIYSEEVPVGGTLNVDLDRLIITNSGIEGGSYFTGDFLKLALGTNTLRFTGTPGVTLLLDWRERYL